MTYIFMDESGDLGFIEGKKDTTNKFIITFVICNNFRPLEKTIKKTLAKIPNQKLKKHSGALHFFYEKPRTRNLMINHFVDVGNKYKDIYIASNIYDKFARKKDKIDTTKLYNKLTSNLLKELLKNKFLNAEEKITLVASQRETNRRCIEEFINTIKTDIFGSYQIDIDVIVKKHFENKSLQVVDAVSWSLFRKHESLDDIYYKLLKDFIKLEMQTK